MNNKVKVIFPQSADEPSIYGYSASEGEAGIHIDAAVMLLPDGSGYRDWQRVTRNLFIPYAAILYVERGGMWPESIEKLAARAEAGR